MMAVPAGNPGEWFSPDDYPPAALRSDRQGRVVVAVGIDSVGKAVTCRVVESSGTVILDQKTCELALAHGTFNPATDDKGLPIASEYVLPVRWQMPEPPEPTAIDVSSAPPPDKIVETELTIGPDGTLLACRTLRVQSDAQSIDPCKNAPIGTKTLRRWHRNGQPVGAKVIQRFVDHTVIDP